MGPLRELGVEASQLFVSDDGDLVTVVILFDRELLGRTETTEDAVRDLGRQSLLRMQEAVGLDRHLHGKLVGRLAVGRDQVDGLRRESARAVRRGR